MWTKYLGMAGLIATYLLILSAAGPARAELVLNRLVIDLDAPGQYRQDLIASNDSKDETIYVQVTVFEVVNPGAPSESWQERRTPEESGLLVAPSRFVLAPGQGRSVRFVSVAPPQQRDRVYRVEIKPVVGELIAQQSVIKVVVGYNVLVIARPAGAQPNIVGQRQGGRLTIRNEGNSTALLSDGLSCDAAEQNCTGIESKRMYPGNELVVNLPQAGPAIYLRQVGLKSEEIRF